MKQGKDGSESLPKAPKLRPADVQNSSLSDPPKGQGARGKWCRGRRGLQGPDVYSTDGWEGGEGAGEGGERCSSACRQRR